MLLLVLRAFTEERLYFLSPGGSEIKNPPANAGDTGSIPG